MRLSRKNEKLLIELVKNKDKLGECVRSMYKNKSNNEQTELNGRFGELRDWGLVNVQFADNIAYFVSLTHKAEDYIEENGLSIELFDKYKLIEILKAIGDENGIANVMIYDISSCGSSQIGWRQTDEYEWQIKVEVSSNLLLVKRVSGQIEHEMAEYGFKVIDKTGDDSTHRFKRYLKFAHESVIPSETIQYGQEQVFEFNIFFNELINACLRLQSYKRVREGTEDEKTTYIRDMLHQKGYIALDQTQRGSSATGKQAGEVDLLICDKDMMPNAVIEALVLSSVDTTNIKLHIDKVSGYDTNGLNYNIILTYVCIDDFQSFAERYKKHIGEAKFKFPLIDIEDISNSQYSEIKVISSRFNRSGLDRQMLHVLINLT